MLIKSKTLKIHFILKNGAMSLNSKWILFITLLATLNINSQEKEVTNVLMVGNSFTFFWNMPQLVDAMAKNQGVRLMVRQSTVGGSNLKQHWNEEKGTVTRKLLREQKWDYVILGDHSLSTIDFPDRFTEYGENFSREIKSFGAEPMLYLTWSYKSNPLMQSTITSEYMNLAKKLNIAVVPVGPIWMRARELRPDLELYFDDKHPSADGSYLIALIVYKAITGKSVDEIPNRITTVDKNGEKLYLSFISPETGTFFRTLVDNTDFQNFKNKK